MQLAGSAEMGAAMLAPVAAILVLSRTGLSTALPLLGNSEHTAMLLGMPAIMLYRRERYTSGYSFIGWPAAAGRRSPGRQLARVGQPHAPARTA
jgi:hypothetical protein